VLSSFNFLSDLTKDDTSHKQPETDHQCGRGGCHQATNNEQPASYDQKEQHDSPPYSTIAWSNITQNGRNYDFAAQNTAILTKPAPHGSRSELFQRYRDT
jgi:hypothetical protein